MWPYYYSRRIGIGGGSSNPSFGLVLLPFDVAIVAPPFVLQGGVIVTPPAQYLPLAYTPQQKLYAIVFDRTGRVWRSSAFESYNKDNLLQYSISYIESPANSGHYVFPFPAIPYGGRFRMWRFAQEHATPTTGDTRLGSQDVEWTGSGLASTLVFAARVLFLKDDQNFVDRYSVNLIRGDQLVDGSEIQSARITVYNADNTVRVPTSNMVSSPGSPALYYDVPQVSNRRVRPGTNVIVELDISIGGKDYRWREPVGRDALNLPVS